jgi:CRP-like cAMP-binding protein
MQERLNYAEVPIFKGIGAEECDRMITCFDVRAKSFHAGEIVYDFEEGRHMVGVLDRGSAVIVRLDEKGGRTILEHLEVGGMFGEMLMFENASGDSVQVLCERNCRVWFMREDQITKRCENACWHHTAVVENMFHLMAGKASALSERVEVLSRRSIREKLLCYCSLLAAKEGTRTPILPFSLSALADYLSTDRSAMMRELKKLRDERTLDIQGGKIMFLYQ